MAAGDWAFPRPGCKCISTTAQAALRPWIGARIADFHPYPGFFNLPHAGVPQHYFLTVRQTNTAVRITTPTLAEDGYNAGDFTIDWSIEPDNYGDFTIYGAIPIGQGNGLPTFPVSGPLIPSFRLALEQMTAPGRYAFSATNTPDIVNVTAWTLDAFDPGEEYRAEFTFNTIRQTIVLVSHTPPAPPVYGTAWAYWTVTWTFSNYFSATMMLELLEEDLQSAEDRPFDSTLIPRNYPIFNFSQAAPEGYAYFYGDTTAARRGGVVQEEDPSPSRDGYIINRILSGGIAESDGLVEYENLAFEPGAYPGDAAIFVSLLRGYPAAFAIRSLIHQAGRHSTELWPLATQYNPLNNSAPIPDTQTGPCLDRIVVCPEDLNDEYLDILDPFHYPQVGDPPIENGERIRLFLNRRCP